MHQPIPILDLKIQYAGIRAEIWEAVERVLESQHFILGPEVAALEKEIAAYSQCEFGIGVSSGTDALLVSLMAVDIKPGDEIITSSYSFFSTAGAIWRLNAKPVFVDIDRRTFNIDPNQIEGAITSKTKAIIPVHLFGQMADMNPIMELAKKHHLHVIEDAAQSIGAECEGERAGSIGHVGCFSFFPSKNLGAFGDAGMVVTNDSKLAEKIRLLRNHGHQPKYFNKLVGGNFRLDELQAAILRIKLKFLDTWTEARNSNAHKYRQLFMDYGFGNPSDLKRGENQLFDLRLPYESGCGRHVYNQFVIITSQRDKLKNFLKDRNISTEIYYPLPLHLQECFLELDYRVGSLPSSERTAKQSLALPIYPELTDLELTRIVRTIFEYSEKYG